MSDQNACPFGEHADGTEKDTRFSPSGVEAPSGDRCFGPQQLKPTLEKQNKQRRL